MTEEQEATIPAVEENRIAGGGRLSVLARHPFLIILLVGLAAGIPLLLNGYPPHSHDGLYHPVWARYFSAQFWNGELYPRWLAEINGGLGDPTFFIYPPIPFYTTALLDPLVPGDPYAFYQLGIACTLVLIGSGCAAFLWLRHIAPSQSSALLGALFYMLAPYHLAVDMYTRGAFAEFYAFLWLPLLLYFIHGVVEKRRHATVWLACCWGGLIGTHPLTAIIFAPLLFLYPLLIAPTGKRVRSLLLTSAGVLLGTGLSAIYWLTAIPHRNLVHIEAQSRKALLYSSNYLFTSTPFADTYQSRLGWIALFTFLLSLIAWWSRQRHKGEGEQEKKNIAGFLLTVAGLSLLMTTPLSDPLWSILPLLQKIQFPYRFLTLLTLAASGLLAAAPLFASAGSGQPKRIELLLRYVIPGTAALSIPILLVAFYSVLSSNSEFYQTNYDRNFTRQQAGLGAIEYVPKSIKVLGKADDRKLVPLVMQIKNYPRLEVKRGEGRARLERNDGRSVVVETDSPAGAVVILYRFYYEGLNATADSGEARVEPTENLGFTRLIAPPGRRRIELRMEALPEEKWGGILSLVSLGTLAGMVIVPLFKKRR